MPISDLLASISGPGKDSGPARSSAAASIKRKASADLPNSATKTQRLTPPPSRPKTTARPSSDRPSSSAQRYTGTAGRTTAAPPSKTGPTTANRPRPAGTSSAAAAPAPVRAAPKKGSFAEILARGKAAQASMGQVGKIQHKKVENAPRRSKEEMKEEAAQAARQAPRGKKPAAAPGYGGTSRPSQRPGGGSGSTNGISKRPGMGASSSSKARPSGPGRKAPPPEPEKKIKKAAVATTGYAGTARPRPGAETSSKRHEAPRGGALLSAPKHRPRGGSKYDDEDDEEMDDFIDYDDEEDDGGEPRYNYASDGSSDMEAGMDDIYDEEDRAARIAHQEDVREKRLEDSLKAAKEERRRRAMGYR